MTVSFKGDELRLVKGDECRVYVGFPASPPVPEAVRALAGFERSLRSIRARRSM